MPLPDTLDLSYCKAFQIDFPSTTATGNRYLLVEGGAWKSEVVGAGSSLTLPSTSYYTDAVVTMGAFYRWVEIVRTEVAFVPASFHVGSSWVAFGRNQALVTSNEIGFSSVNDVI